jgi:hypothetical protein
MRWHEIANTPGEYPMTDSQVEELLQPVGNIRLSDAGCSRRQPAALRDRTRAEDDPDQ